MTPADGQLVLGDRMERETRAVYRQAMEQALIIVRDLAEPGPPATRLSAQGTVAGAEHVHWRPGPPSVDVQRAQQVGWLVAVPHEVPHLLETGPLAGLGVAVKDIIDVAGMQTHNGTPGGEWRDAATSATAWQRLADAGARCIGKAATHEMAWGVTTPQVPNPHDPHRVTGGSSGGSAACVAAGIAQGALGTDTGGSIRIPAALCGVVGIRPTLGSIPLTGITPLARSQDTVGPLATDVATCTAMLEVLLNRPLHLPIEHLSTLRVGVLAAPGRLDRAMTTAYEETISRLEAAGITVVACETEVLRWAAAVSLLTMLWESADQHAELVQAAPLSFGSEARALLTVGKALPSDTKMLEGARDVLGARTADLFAAESLDAFLTPTTACVAPLRQEKSVLLADRDVPVATALSRFTAWASATGLPAASVPVATAGLPAGMQFMAPPNHEAICLLLGRTVEATVAPGSGHRQHAATCLVCGSISRATNWQTRFRR
jgi:Asp-tRNA(Asn)/Glu-tRNA(Gln) amidotransferase A subunit family amidase